MLENERLLAALLLAPTVLLLGVFIAYPFVMGVWLALSSTSVGNPGHFVGLKNFIKAFNDSIFRTAFWNTVWYTAWATVFKLVLGMWLALLLNRNFRGKRLVRASMLLPFIVPTVLSTLRLAVDVRSDLQRAQLAPLRTGLHRQQAPFLSDGVYGDVLRHRRQHLARHAVLRHHPAGRPSDDQPRSARGRRPRRRQRLEALLERHLAAAEARDAES